MLNEAAGTRTRTRKPRLSLTRMPHEQLPAQVLNMKPAEVLGMLDKVAGRDSTILIMCRRSCPSMCLTQSWLRRC